MVGYLLVQIYVSRIEENERASLREAAIAGGVVFGM